jgi:hypothetical protein
MAEITDIPTPAEILAARREMYPQDVAKLRLILLEQWNPGHTVSFNLWGWRSSSAAICSYLKKRGWECTVNEAGPDPTPNIFIWWGDHGA